MRRGSGSSVLLTINLTLALAAGQALAQRSAPPSSGTLEEVTVTAQRRSENLQDVPLAVSSFSAAALNAQQMTETLYIAREVPNFIASNNVGQASANVYYIRGLGQTQSFPTFEPQVGTYVDDIYIGRQNANNLSLFGVDQLQVLRGPQGTLFGRNSTGGAIVVSLEKPATALGGGIEAGYGAYGRVSVRGSIDAPISDQLRTRFSAFGINDDGFVHNATTGEKMNKTRDWGVREAIEFVPAGSKIDWNLSFDFSDNNAANVLNQPGLWLGIKPYDDRFSLSGFSQNGGALAPFLSGDKAARGQGVDVRSWGAMSNIRIGFDSGVLNVITGYRGMKQMTAVDFPDLFLGFPTAPLVPFDQNSYGQFTLAQELKSSEYTQEFKWTGEAGTRLKYTAGVFYLYETNNNEFGAVVNFGPLCFLFIPNCFLPSLPFPIGDQKTVNDTRSSAIYAQGDYKLTDALTLTVGGRFTHEEKSVTAAAVTAGSGFTTADIVAAGYKTDLTANEFTPRVALEYKADPNLMFFASATRGFQGGGWNGLAFKASPPAPIATVFNDFAPETVWSYELGMRSETSDHRVRLNVTAFYEDVSKYQLLSDNAAANQFVTNNAADLNAYGLEAELAWRPLDHLTLSVNLGFLDAKYHNPSAIVLQQQASCRAGTGGCGSGIVDAAGNLATPSDTPHSTGSLRASYDWLVGDFTVTTNVGVQRVGEQNVGTEGSPAGVNQPVTTFDAALGLKPNSMPLTFTAECRNCAKKDWGTAYLFGYKYYNVPGVWDVRVSYKF